MGGEAFDRDGAADPKAKAARAPVPPPAPPPPPPSAVPAAKADDFGLSEVITFYLQQTSAVNQLWAMFAATTFAAGAFGLTVADGRSKWLLLAGALGFFFFAVGHFNMVISAVTRQEKARRDIARLVKSQDLGSRYLILRHLAGQKTSIKHARNVHLAIDLCVYIGFGLAALFGEA